MSFARANSMWKLLVQLLHCYSQVSIHLMVFHVPTFLGKQKTWRSVNKSTGASKHLCELFTVFMPWRSRRANWTGWSTACSGGGAPYQPLPLLGTWAWLCIMQSEELSRGCATEKFKWNSTPRQYQKSSFPAWYTSLVVTFSYCFSAPLL